MFLSLCPVREEVPLLLCYFIPVYFLCGLLDFFSQIELYFTFIFGCKKKQTILFFTKS